MNKYENLFDRFAGIFKQTSRKSVSVPKLYSRGRALGQIVSHTGARSTPKLDLTFNNNANMVPQSINVSSNNSVQALPENPNRKYLLIQNVSGDSIVVNFGSEAVVSPQQGFLIYDNGNYEPSIAPKSSIEIIGTVATNQLIHFMEGV